jgi:hypothetical protein
MESICLHHTTQKTHKSAAHKKKIKLFNVHSVSIAENYRHVIKSSRYSKHKFFKAHSACLDLARVELWRARGVIFS